MRRLSFISLIIALTGLGLALRLANLSPYLVYPDSYTSLVVSLGPAIGGWDPSGYT